MTFDERQTIRQAVDVHVRELVSHQVSDSPRDFCGACKCELDAWTAGCQTCNNRHRKRMIDYNPTPDTAGYEKLRNEKQVAALALGGRF